MNTWLHITYKIPRQPSARRVRIWRKLKRLGALHLHESIWVLPNNNYTYEQFQWLVVEIKDLGGEASLWEAKIALGLSNDELKQKFLKQVNVEYEVLLKQLTDNTSNLVDLAKKYQQIKLVDYFHSPLEREVREQIKRKRGYD
ncbi:Chromate resistance protein ChrB [Bacillus sp. FJAT-44742]|uniref:Chromate resistance protein ChrB n=1 Tax=Bacillus sp. FJAT-44742 TaxID=2014005 RepID=UPI000C237390|nr:Chromate resistance protein ChrB [Bacillus sp. FJAT-44742]